MFILSLANSFAGEAEGSEQAQSPGGPQPQPQAGKQQHQPRKEQQPVKYSEEFIKKMEEWEQKKGLAGMARSIYLQCTIMHVLDEIYSL